MNPPAIVCDTSILLYLGRVQQVSVLNSLYSAVYVPSVVVKELDVGRYFKPNTIDPRIYAWMTIVRVSQSPIDSLPLNRLGAGERSVIAFARLNQLSVAGLDDRQARLLASALDIQVVGFIGVLLKAKQQKLVATSVKSILDQARQSGFRISSALYQEALRLAGE